MKLMLGNCLDKLKELDANSVDSIVTDPPYGLSFMGKKWDYDVPSSEIWEECLRVLKPGGHLLAFAGTRTQHRMAVRIEDAGFEIRDMIAWVYGSGFPKSHNISKAIDKMAGAEREVKGVYDPRGMYDGKERTSNAINTNWRESEGRNDAIDMSSKTITEPATDDAKKWDGWGTALKPALEPITVARKPLEEKTIAKNVLKYGTGAINIDESRVQYEKEVPTQGRFPANLIHDGSEEVDELFPFSKSTGGKTKRTLSFYGKASSGESLGTGGFADEGSAARFFYVPKTSKKDRNEGVEKNNHPTVKPTDLMRYLVRMVTPKGGTTLDPFMGSGSTGKAAKIEGFNFIGIELDEEYFEIAKSRIERAQEETSLEDFFI